MAASFGSKVRQSENMIVSYFVIYDYSSKQALKLQLSNYLNFVALTFSNNEIHFE